MFLIIIKATSDGDVVEKAESARAGLSNPLLFKTATVAVLIVIC